MDASLAIAGRNNADVIRVFADPLPMSATPYSTLPQQQAGLRIGDAEMGNRE